MFLYQLIEAHESTLRALTLTANGTLLATASHKGTVIRIWNVSNSQNVYEFRRGVERATITCLCFSWDDQWLACSSDKGTTHVFYCEDYASHNKKDGSNRSSSGKKTPEKKSTTSSLLSSGTRYLASSFSSSASKKPQPKSVCQIRGVPHPLACAFIGDAPSGNLLAVAGWDNDGNGVLLVSEFAAHQEARRVAYHVLVKNAQHKDETEEERRRRRARGWRPSAPETPHPDDYFGHLTISDEQADVFQTQTTDDDFCEVIMEPRKEPSIDDKATATTVSNSVADGEKTQTTTEVPHDEVDVQKKDLPGKNDQDATDSLSDKDSTTNQDSIAIEPLEDDPDENDIQ